jgi:hypothetical protein
VVTTPEAKQVIHKVYDALKPRGRWVTRVMVHGREEEEATPETLNEIISSCKIDQEVYEMLYVPFIAYYKKEIGAAIGLETTKRLERDVKKGIFPAVCAKVFRSQRHYTNENYIVKKEELERDTSHLFAVQRIFENTERFSKNWPIYVFRKT